MAGSIGQAAPSPFALGQLSDGPAASFAALIVDSWYARVDNIIEGVAHVTDLLDAWHDNLHLLGEEAARIRRQPDPGVGSDVGRWAELRVLAPVHPRQIFQAGANYRSHMMDLALAGMKDREGEEDPVALRERIAAVVDAHVARDQPYVFIGLPSAVSGALDDIVLPSTGVQHDWELELAAVIGRPTFRVSRVDALNSVAGYTMVNDVTTRDRVFRPDIPTIGTDWLAGKNAPTFLPTGPWLVPAPFIADPMDLQISLRLNGKIMQDETTADMIFDPARIIEHVSSIAQLLPGDLVLTGSPAGNGAHCGRFLAEGDVLDATITGLGAQRNVCRGAPK